MSLIDLAIAKEHLRVIGADDDATIEVYLGAAEESAAQFIQRGIFIDDAALAGAVAAAYPALQTSLDAIMAARIAAYALTDCEARRMALEAACAASTAAETAYSEAVRGIVLNQAITAAILLTLGHLYANREDVVTNATAVGLPNGAKALLQPYRVSMGV